jgi:hypothetical protein
MCTHPAGKPTFVFHHAAGLQKEIGRQVREKEPHQPEKLFVRILHYLGGLKKA